MFFITSWWYLIIFIPPIVAIIHCLVNKVGNYRIGDKFTVVSIHKKFICKITF